MLDFLKDWLMGVTAAALLVAAADAVMPPGTVHRLGRLTGGLVLLLAVLSPLLRLDGTALSRALTQYQLSQPELSELEAVDAVLLKELIEERSDAYISDKAEGLGIQCRVVVETQAGEDGYPIPWAVTSYGNVDAAQRAALERRIEADFAIPAARQTYKVEETQ